MYIISPQNSVPAVCSSEALHLVVFEEGASTRSETLLTAEALELGAHEQRIALHALLLTPDADDRLVLLVLR